MTYWTHILTLLTFAVLVDERVYKEEVDCFSQQALSLSKKISPDMLFSQKMAFDWFVAHRDEKLKQLKSENADAHLLVAITALAEHKDCELILTAIQAIADSDGEYHDKESDLVKLCRAHWGI